MGKMINGRADEIRRLKKVIATYNEEIKALVLKLPDQTDVGVIRERLAFLRGALAEAKKSLEMVRMNKYGSKEFSWEPHKGMNRTQARAFRRVHKRAITAYGNEHQ